MRLARSYSGRHDSYSVTVWYEKIGMNLVAHFMAGLSDYYAK